MAIDKPLAFFDRSSIYGGNRGLTKNKGLHSTLAVASYILGKLLYMGL